MPSIRNTAARSRKFAFGPSILLVLLGLSFSVAASPAFGQDRSRPETIEATASGTDIQAGTLVNVTLVIYEYNPRSDQQILISAFENGKDQGLYNALSKMRAMGRIAITGTLGFDVSYIQMVPTPTGRKIRFITNRLLRFGEVWWDARSESYNLTAGEIDLNDEDKTKSTGVLYPAADLVMNRDHEVQFNLIGSPWKLVNIVDWKGTAGVN